MCTRDKAVQCAGLYVFMQHFAVLSFSGNEVTLRSSTGCSSCQSCAAVSSCSVSAVLTPGRSADSFAGIHDARVNMTEVLRLVRWPHTAPALRSHSSFALQIWDQGNSEITSHSWEWVGCGRVLFSGLGLLVLVYCISCPKTHKYEPVLEIQKSILRVGGEKICILVVNCFWEMQFHIDTVETQWTTFDWQASRLTFLPLTQRTELNNMMTACVNAELHNTIRIQQDLWDTDSYSFHISQIN